MTVLDDIVRMRMRVLAAKGHIVYLFMCMMFVRMEMAMFMFQHLVNVNVSMVLAKHEPRAKQHERK